MLDQLILEQSKVFTGVYTVFQTLTWRMILKFYYLFCMFSNFYTEDVVHM